MQQTGHVLVQQNKVVKQINSSNTPQPCVTSAVIITSPVTVTITGPGVAIKVQVDADGRCEWGTCAGTPASGLGPCDCCNDGCHTTAGDGGHHEVQEVQIYACLHNSFCIFCNALFVRSTIFYKSLKTGHQPD